ncbi:alpha/beta fold hydrolase [Leucobacter sp. HY1908]
MSDRSAREGPGGRSSPRLRIAGLIPGVQFVRREATATSPAFDLAYVRRRARDRDPGAMPAVVIPGGPGLGSVLPYRTLRRLAVRGGLDLIMVEHRGVGFSRHDLDGRDLPASAMRITDVLADIDAVLDREGVSRARIVGSSYGSYLATCFGAAYPHRVAGMLLDSALQSAEHLELERSCVRALLWDGDGERQTAVRALYERGIDDRVLLDVVRAAYELGGDDLLLPLLRGKLRGSRGARATWRALESYATRDASITRIPGIYEFDLVGTIGFRELGYGGEPDGLPLDPARTYAPLVHRFEPFAGEPFDLAHAVREFDWPLVLLAGERDLRTPAAIAERVAARAPQATLVPIKTGHSALDTQPVALLNALKWLEASRQSGLPAVAGRLDRLPLRGFAARLPQLLRCGVWREPRRAKATVDPVSRDPP